MNYSRLSEAKQQNKEEALPWILKACFLTSILSVYLGTLLTYLLKRPVFVYYLFYFLVFLITLNIIANFRKINLAEIPSSIRWFFLYLVITIFFSLINSNFLSLFVLIKNYCLPFLFLLYLLLIMRSKEKLTAFIRMMVFGGVFLSLFIIAEVVNKAFNLFPSIDSMIYSYASMSNPSNLIQYVNIESNVYRELFSRGIIRPRGFDVSLTASAFFLGGALVFLFVCGNRVIKSRRTMFLCIFLLYAGTVLTTSRQVTVSLNLVLLFSYILTLKRGRLSAKLVSNVRSNFLAIVFSLIFIGIIILFRPGGDKWALFFQTGLKGGASGVLLPQLLQLPSKLIIMLRDFPFQGLFGIGGYSYSREGVILQLPSIGELHFFLGHIILFGVIGFVIYWAIFLHIISICWRGIHKRAPMGRSTKDGLEDIYFSGFLLCFFYILNLVHYSPTGVTTNFTLGLVFFISSIPKLKARFT